MKTRFLPVALLALFFSACATPRYDYRPVAQEISRPPLDSVNIANVGDEMVSQGIFSEQDAIKLSKTIRVGAFGAYTLTPGYYVKTGEDESGAFYRPAQGRESGEVQKGALVDPWEAIQLSKDGGTISVVTVFHLKTGTSAEGVTKTTYPLLSDQSFQQTLIYSGRFGDKIRIGYREFSNNSARPAFNNDVEYDLSQSKVIGYKGARLEIIEATNEYIKYRVISNFNRATK